MKHSRKIHILLLIFTVLVLSVKLSFAVDAPTSFHATAINENQINLDWILNAGNDSILLVFNTTDTFDIPVDGICYDTGYVFPSGAKVLFKDTSTSFSHTGLTDNTVYYYKIWSFSAGCFYSIGVIDSAQTYCQKIGGTSEGFENNGNIPDCWRQEYVMGTDDWVFTYGNTTTNNPNAPYAGNYCAVLNGSNVKTKLILPKFDFDTVTTGITLSLRVFTTANSSLKIYYKTSDTTSWILFHTISASENWANYVYQMPDLSGNYFIALEGYSNSNASNNGVCIDNVVVADGTCSLPATPTQPFGSNCCFGGMTTSISCSTSSSGATSYEWSSQQPGVISSGQGSSSVSVGNVLCGSIYTVCVTPHNSCGYGPSRLGSVCNDPGDQSLNGSTINGNPTPCIGSTQTYYDSDVANVSGFHWDYPSGWTVISEDNTGTYVSITLIVGSSSGEIKLFGTGLNELCGACPVIPLSFPVNPITVPNAPSAISGNTTPCQSSNTTYSVSNVSGVSYNWTVPSGWSINNGQGTNQISVTVGSSSGNITVTPSNTCGSGTSTSLWVTPNLLPNQPSPISGDTVMCEKDTLNYSIIDEGFQYNWSFPSGWIQISGGNNNSVSVLSSNVSGTITVTPSNICGNGPPSTLYVSPLSVPANQGQITGNNYPCYGDTEIYILSNPIADYYLWSLPTNWSIISGDSTATITTLIGDSSGQITMFPYNTCGEGDSSNLYVSVNNSTPSITTIYGNNSPCDNSQEYYYITANPEENYLWSLPTGYTFVSGQGTDSILVNIGNTADTIILIPSNSCGFGDTSKIFIDPIPLVYSDVNILANPGFSICEGTSVILNPSPTNGGNNPTFQWFVNDTLFNNTDTITLSSIQDSLEIFVIMTVDTTCPANNPVSSDTSYFTVFNNPSVNIFGDSIACGNTTLNVDTGQSVVEYLWSTGDTTQTILATSSGIYTITITDTNNCKNSDSLYITINPIPSIYLGADTILCEKDSITLAVDTNFSYFSWSTGDTVSNITIDSSGIGIDTVNIFVQVIDSNGCSNSDTIQIIFDDCTKLISLNNKEITIYPNPTTSKIIINGQNIVSITVTDLLGKQLYYSGKNIKYIDLGKFQDGIYIIKISTPKGIISKKIILAK